MRRYETIFILRPNIGEDEITKIIESTQQIIIDAGGTIIELNRWGMKKLAYLIKKESLGYYVYCDYAGVPEAVNEIERKFRIDDAVLKYLTVKTSEDISAEGIQQAMADASAKQAAAEEADQDSADDSDDADTDLDDEDSDE